MRAQGHDPVSTYSPRAETPMLAASAAAKRHHEEEKLREEELHLSGLGMLGWEGPSGQVQSGIDQQPSRLGSLFFFPGESKHIVYSLGVLVQRVISRQCSFLIFRCHLGDCL